MTQYYTSTESTSEEEMLDNNKLHDENKFLKNELRILKKKLNKSNIKKNNNNNYNTFNKIKKYIKIIYGYIDLISYREEIYIYGELLENLFRKKNLNNNKLFFLFKTLNPYYFNQIVQCLHNMDCIINEDYDIEKRMFNNEEGEYIVIVISKSK